MLDRRKLSDDRFTHAEEQFVFEFDAPLLGAEDFALHFLQFRRDEPLAVGDGLLADVMGRNFVEVRPGDFKVVAEDRVEPHLERRDAGALDFLQLEFRDPILAFARRVAQFVETGVEAVADKSAILHGERRLVHDRAGNQFDEVGKLAELRFQLA